MIITANGCAASVTSTWRPRGTDPKMEKMMLTCRSRRRSIPRARAKAKVKVKVKAKASQHATTVGSQDILHGNATNPREKEKGRIGSRRVNGLNTTQASSPDNGVTGGRVIRKAWVKETKEKEKEVWGCYATITTSRSRSWVPCRMQAGATTSGDGKRHQRK